jgi:hypothetical protein
MQVLKTNSFSAKQRAERSALERAIGKADLLLSKVRQDRLRLVVELSSLKLFGRLLASRSSVTYRCHPVQKTDHNGGGLYPTAVRRRILPR